MRSSLKFFAGMVLLISVAGCSAGVDLFTKQELDEMYVLNVSQADKTLRRGASLDNTKPVDISVDIMPGSPSPSFIRVLLLNSEEKELARISFAKKSGDPNLAEKFIVVASFEDPLPPLILPAKLPFGYYSLSTQILDQDSEVLSTINTSLLVYELATPQMSISLYPAQLNASRSALFKAALSGSISKEAWISWKIDGVVYSEGFVSEKFDRIIWTAPADKGIHSISADFFPFKPLSEEPVMPLVSSEIRTPVIMPSLPAMPIPAGDSFVSFNFNKGLDNTGSRALPGMNILGSKPYPEEFPNGYGFALGDGSGLSSQIPMIPWSTSGQDDFSILFSLAALPDMSLAVGKSGSNGNVLFRTFDSANQLVLELGIANGVPYVKSDTRVDAFSLVPKELGVLVFNFHATGGLLEVTIFIDGMVAGTGKLEDARIGASQGISELAGVNGFKAVYNDFSVYDHLLPAFAVSMATMFSDSLIQAISFTDEKSDPPRYALFGRNPILQPQGLVLSNPEDGLLVEIPPETNRFKMALRTRTGSPVVSVLLNNGQSIQIMQNGTVLYMNQAQGTLSRFSNNLIIEKQNEAILISTDFRDSQIVISETGVLFSSLRINPAGNGLLEVESLLILNSPK